MNVRHGRTRQFGGELAAGATDQGFGVPTKIPEFQRIRLLQQGPNKSSLDLTTFQYLFTS
jgi:hypothetical protein